MIQLRIIYKKQEVVFEGYFDCLSEVLRALNFMKISLQSINPADHKITIEKGNRGEVSDVCDHEYHHKNLNKCIKCGHEG